MRRRTLLAGVVGLGAGGAVGWYADGTIEKVQSSDPVATLSGKIDGPAAELQLEPTQFEKPTWEVVDDQDTEIERYQQDSSKASSVATRTFYDHDTSRLVATMVVVYDDLGGAVNRYDQVEDGQGQQYSITEVDHGDDGFGYVTDSAVVVFRQANVIAIISDTARELSLKSPLEIAALMTDGW